MDQQARSHRSGSYTANLLGNIKSHLARLQGYDVMALELIQNADDAKAESIIFDITDSGLFVINSGLVVSSSATTTVVNMVEIETGVLRNQCLDRRIGERERFICEIAA